MAVQTLTMGLPNRTALATTRTRYVVPRSPVVVRIFCADAAVLFEPVDGADGSATGSAYETIPAGVPTPRRIGRGEFCLSVASGTPTAEVTAEEPAP